MIQNLVIASSVFLFSFCHSNYRPYNGIEWQQLNSNDWANLPAHLLWQDRGKQKSLILYSRGKSRFYSSAISKYIYTSGKKIFLLKTEYDFSIWSDTLYFHQEPFDSFSMEGNRWFKIEGNSYEILDSIVIAKKEISKYYGWVIKLDEKKLRPIAPVTHLKNITDIHVNGIYYLSPPGFNVIFKQPLLWH